MEDGCLKHILVVDDQEDYRLMIQAYLSKMGYDCDIASDAFEGMEKLRSKHFELVISDIRMEKKDGLQFMKEAREDHPNLEFIIMTGHAGEYSYSDIIASGATDFISKPFESGKLKSKLERIERERRALQELREANNQLHDMNKALKREVEINASISELSRGLIGSLSIDEISSLVLKHARHLTASPLGFTGYIDQKTGYFVSPTMTRDIWDECQIANKDNIFKEFGGLWGWVLKNRKALLTNKPQDDDRSSEVPQGHLPINRFLSVPAIAGGALLGQVALANSERDYTSDDLTTVQNLAAIYALSIQRKWTEEELKEANEHLENVFENAAEAIGIVDEHGRFMKWNKAAEVLYGYTFDELKGKPFLDLYSDKNEIDRLLEQLRQNGFVYGYDVSARRKDGSIVPFRISIRVLRDKEGKIVGSVGVATDLSDIKDSLTQLKLINEQLQAEMAEREQLAEELRTAGDELEKLVVERTERLSRAGSLLKRSIDRLKEITEE